MPSGSKKSSACNSTGTTHKTVAVPIDTTATTPASLIVASTPLSVASPSTRVSAAEECQLNLDWPTRLRICIGIARGLAFLHVESRLKIVHTDIKTTNVLLDGDLNPKISDFGLAKLQKMTTPILAPRLLEQ